MKTLQYLEVSILEWNKYVARFSDEFEMMRLLKDNKDLKNLLYNSACRELMLRVNQEDLSYKDNERITRSIQDVPRFYPQARDHHIYLTGVEVVSITPVRMNDYFVFLDLKMKFEVNVESTIPEVKETGLPYQPVKPMHSFACDATDTITLQLPLKTVQIEVDSGEFK